MGKKKREGFPSRLLDVSRTVFLGEPLPRGPWAWSPTGLTGSTGTHGLELIWDFHRRWILE